jgi:two-component sensor histidine kinase
MTIAKPHEDYELVRLREAEHRHRNALQMLSGLVRRQRHQTRDAAARDALAYVGELIDVFGDIEAELRHGGVADLALQLETLGNRVQKLCPGLVRIDVMAETVFLPSRQITASSLIALELLLNAIKHAFPAGLAGTIRISLRLDETNHATLSVIDDGVGAAAAAKGIHDGADGGTQAGTGLVDALATTLGGDVSRGPLDGSGHMVSVRWPL